MFVEYLNEHQQGALLHYARQVMLADGMMDAEEQVYLAVLQKQVNPLVQAENISLDELPRVFDGHTSRVAFLLELMGMGYSNEQFDPHQSDTLQEIAAAISLTDHVEAIRSWVIRQLALVREAHSLMRGDHR